MITFEEARAIVLEQLNSFGIECQIMDTVEKPYGWCFFYQSRRYLETHDFGDALAGNAPMLVERETGRLIVLGTAFPFEKYLEVYESGFFRRRYDLTITRLRLWHQTIRMLKKLGLQYADPSSPSRRVLHSQESLEHAMEHLPQTFEDQYYEFGSEVFDEMDETRCCTYQITWRTEVGSHGGQPSDQPVTSQANEHADSEE